MFRRLSAIPIAASLLFAVACSSAPASTVSKPPEKHAALSSPAPTPVVVLSALPSQAPVPTALAIRRSLTSVLKSPALGGHVGIAVGDVLTGAILFQVGPKAPNDRFIPASSIKLFTAAAVLLTNSPDTAVTFKRNRISLSRLIEMTLTESDNDGADLLSTFVPGSTAQALSAAFPALDLSASTLSDASGLSRQDRTTPATLVQLLVILANPANPEFAPILSGLPIAGLTGTLKMRAKAVSGQFRAKTGTLTGVDVLSGYVVDSSKRLLAFAVMADQVPRTEPARAKLDEIAGALVKLS